MPLTYQEFAKKYKPLVDDLQLVQEIIADTLDFIEKNISTDSSRGFWDRLKSISDKGKLTRDLINPKLKRATKILTKLNLEISHLENDYEAHLKLQIEMLNRLAGFNMPITGNNKLATDYNITKLTVHSKRRELDGLKNLVHAAGVDIQELQENVALYIPVLPDPTDMPPSSKRH